MAFSRRNFLGGAVAAPAILKLGLWMPIKPESLVFCENDALIWLRIELVKSYAEILQIPARLLLAKQFTPGDYVARARAIKVDKAIRVRAIEEAMRTGPL